ncbi:MAG: TonB family protein [Deltaproteobacteria bacterium]|nr:TonB family protein [Deltaproteobacteria bacterium]
MSTWLYACGRMVIAWTASVGLLASGCGQEPAAAQAGEDAMKTWRADTRRTRLRGPSPGILAFILAACSAASAAEPAEPVPRIEVEPAEVGNPSKELRTIMRRVIRTHRAEIDACTDAHPGSAGTLVLAFRLEPDGRLAGLRAPSHQGLPDGLAQCVLEAMRAWRLPRPRSGSSVQLRYPLELPLPGARDRPAPRWTAKPGGSFVRGALSREQLLSVIKAHLKEIQHCWESDLRCCPPLMVKVVVRFQIGPDGAVVEAGIEQDSSASEQLETCILEAVRSWRFPKPRDGAPVSVSYPFIFRPAGM